MNWLRTALLFCVCLGLTAKAMGQSLPAAPANGLRDDTRALTEKAQTELAGEISACRKAIQADVWFTAGTFLSSGQTIRLQARELRQHWSPNQDAVLMAYDRASDTHALSFSPGLWQRYPSAEIISTTQRSALIMGEKDTPLETRIPQTLKAVMRDLQTLEKERLRSQTTLSVHHTRLAKIFVLGLTGSAVVLALVGMAVRRRDVQAAWQSFFPEVKVGIRFGAPHGGGVMVEKPPHSL